MVALRLPGDRAGKAVGGRAAALRCGGRPFGPTALRCSVPGGERRTRPRMAGISLRELPVLGARTGCARRIALGRCATPVPLRSSAPQRRFAARPPTALPAAPSGSKASATSQFTATRRAVASCTAGSRRGAGGRRVRRLCGAEQRSAAGAVRRAAPDRRERYGPAPFRGRSRMHRRRPAELRWRPRSNSACALLPAGTGGPPARPAQGSPRIARAAAAKLHTPPTRTSACSAHAKHHAST